jgi:Mn2+/Fe2+ NRAMP family transporter
MVILLAATNTKIIGDYRHPKWMQVAGWVVVLAMTYMGFISLVKIWPS